MPSNGGGGSRGGAGEGKGGEEANRQKEKKWTKRMKMLEKKVWLDYDQS